MVDRRPPATSDDEEVTGLAGWLYTDLLLGLAVVFLGAITFTVARAPENDGNGAAPSTSSTSTTSTTTTTTIPVPCRILPPPNEKEKYRLALRTGLPPNEIAADIDAQLQVIRTLNGITTDSGVGFVIVWGDGLNGGQGSADARRKWETLLAAAPDTFKATTPARFLWDDSLFGDRVNVDVFLQTGECG